MYNAAIKLAIAAVAITTATSCATKSQETVEAENLLTMAENAVTQGNPEQAIILLDSLNKAYPTQIEVQRKALQLRPRAIESGTIAQLSQTDSLIATYQAENEQLKPAMKLISDKDLVEPYYVPVSGYNPQFLKTTGIQPRVDEIGQFYIISSVSGKNLRHTSITLKSPAGEVSTPAVPYDGETNYRSSGSEMITYLPEQCDTIGQFVVENISQPITLIFNSENGKTTSSKLSQAEIKGIADAYRYSRSIINGRDLTVKRQKLERQLQIARDQAARTAQ